MAHAGLGKLEHVIVAVFDRCQRQLHWGRHIRVLDIRRNRMGRAANADTIAATNCQHVATTAACFAGAMAGMIIRTAAGAVTA